MHDVQLLPAEMRWRRCVESREMYLVRHSRSFKCLIVLMLGQSGVRAG